MPRLQAIPAAPIQAWPVNDATAALSGDRTLLALPALPAGHGGDRSHGQSCQGPQAAWQAKEDISPRRAAPARVALAKRNSAGKTISSHAAKCSAPGPIAYCIGGSSKGQHVYAWPQQCIGAALKEVVDGKRILHRVLRRI